jgi:hypothetical protein
LAVLPIPAGLPHAITAREIADASVDDYDALLLHWV